jgi:hypothetical protein
MLELVGDRIRIRFRKVVVQIVSGKKPVVLIDQIGQQPLEILPRIVGLDGGSCRGAFAGEIGIDDGYASAHAHVLKAAEKIQKRTGKTIKLIWFINPAFLGRTDTTLPRMTCEDLQAGFEAGFYDVQSHTANHQDLTTLDPDQLKVEFKQARDQLVTCIGDRDRDHQVAQHVAYPFGAVNATVIQYARRYHLSGYVYDSRLLRVLPWRDRYRLSRLPVNASMPVEKLKKWAANSSW